MEQPGLEILDDEPLDGAATIVDRLVSEQDKATSAAPQRHPSQEVGGAGDRGPVQDLLKRFRGIKEVADFGTHSTKLEYLAFHVPPGGTGQLQLEFTETQRAAVQLKVMGLGGGSGRQFTLGTAHDLGTRDECFALGAWIEVRLRTFRGRNDAAPEELRVDVEAVTNSYLEPFQPCKLCFTNAGRLPARAHPMGGVGWDLTADDKGTSDSLTLEFTAETEMEVTLDLPGLLPAGLVPGVAMKREVRSRCSAKYTFPGRANFVGYELIGKRRDFPFWGRS
jgi:hypothetical protein